jgi:hypothetical protein
MNNLSSSGAMSLEEIDRLLVAWRANLAMSSQNLLALDDLATYKRLTGEDGAPPPALTGVSGQRVPPALAEIATLFDNLQVLTGIIDKASKLREAIPKLFATEHSRSNIDQLLNGNSIQLPSIQTPLAQRGLLSQSDVPAAISPSYLLDKMTRTFEAAKAVVLEVDAAWTRLQPDLEAMCTEANTLSQMATSLGARSLPELMAVQARIVSLHNAIESDPLGTSANVKRELTPMLEAARARVNALAADRDRMRASLADATRLIAAIRQAQLKGAETLRLYNQQIASTGTMSAPLSETAPGELLAWLNTLEATFNGGMMRPTEVGLTRWKAAADAALLAAQTLLRDAGDPVEALAELRGRFAAQRSRAQSSAGAASDPTFLKLETITAALLDVEPVDLSRATAAVEAYERRLRERVQRKAL